MHRLSTPATLAAQRVETGAQGVAANAAVGAATDERDAETAGHEIEGETASELGHRDADATAEQGEEDEGLKHDEKYLCRSLIN